MKVKLAAGLSRLAFLHPLCAEPDAGDGGGGSPPAPPAAPPPPPAATPGDGDGVWYGDSYKALGEEAGVFIAKNGYKSHADVLKTAMNQEKLLGLPAAQLLKLPADRSPDKLGEVFVQLGKPESAEAYGLKEDASRGLDGPLMQAFPKLAHDLHLLPFQVEGLLKFIGDNYVAGAAARDKDAEAAFAAAETAIKGEFGDAFEDKIDAIDAFISEHGGPEMQAYLFKSGRGNDPVFAKFMDKVVALCAEGGLPGEKGRSGGPGGRKLSPAEAEAELRAFEAANDAALRDRAHPDHKALVGEREKLIAKAYPEAAR